MSRREISYLILVVTRSCNLSCVYCYENACRHDGAAMSLQTAEQAVGLAAASGKPFHIQLSGGEPLLAPDTIFAVMELIRKKGIPAFVSLQTNGVLLDREMIRSLNGYGVSIGLSLDGPPRLQEELRGGSAATYRALSLLEDEGVPFRVTTVVSDCNVTKLQLLPMSLHGFSMASGIALDLLVKKGRAGQSGRCGLPAEPELRSGVWKLLETIRLLNRERRRPLELREELLVRQAFFKGSRGHYCAASCGSSLAVTPEGYLYPCTQTMGDPSCYLGQLEDVCFREHSSPLMSSVVDEAGCSDCPLEGRCPGECPSRLLYNRGNGERLFCELYRTIVDFCVQTGDIVV